MNSGGSTSSGPVPGATAGRRLRVAVLLDGFRQPAWVHRAIDAVRQLDVASIVVAVVVPADRGDGSPEDGGSSLFARYERFDTGWFKDDRSDPFAPVDVAPLLADVPRLDAAGTRADALAAQLATYDLDVLLHLAATAPDAELARAARHGVWSYVGGSAGDPRLDPEAPGYWEVLRGEAVTRTALRADLMPHDDDGTTRRPERRLIYESFASTSPLSAWKNRREAYWKTSAFVARKLRELADAGPSALAPIASRGAAPAPARTPRTGDMVRHLPQVAARYLSTQATSRAAFDQWFVAYRLRDGAPAEEGVPDTDLARYTPLVPPSDRIWADPFPIVHGGRHWLFLEELRFARNLGHIAVMEFGDDGRPTRPERVLETENHLSYPFLLQWKGETFMVPESARAGDNPAAASSTSVPYFRCRRFPGDWVQEGAMLEGLEAFDPTIVEIDGRWWLFCTQSEPGASTWDELHLYHGPTPFGPWTPHPRNPVKSDVRSARPAGRPFRQGGAWFRPAQDCSVRYGYGMTINRIERLTTTEYREVEVMSIRPDWMPHLIGTHTLNAAGRLSVTDGRLRRWKWSRGAPELPARGASTNA